MASVGPFSRLAVMKAAARYWWPDRRNGARHRGAVDATSGPSCFQPSPGYLLRGDDTGLYALLALIPPVLPGRPVQPAIRHHCRSCLKYMQRGTAFLLPAARCYPAIISTMNARTSNSGDARPSPINSSRAERNAVLLSSIIEASGVDA